MIERPQGYEHETRDCTVVALTLVCNRSYYGVHGAFKKFGRKDKHGIRAKNIIQKVCKELNLKCCQVKRSGSVEKFIKDFPSGKYFCLKTGHAFSVIDGVPINLSASLKSHIQGAWKIEE